ncbi:MAG: hypothetical protein MUC56_03405 [Thermoanaerobaculales bacterium]|jgi:hypothetical protein|nr:hypothetical protein [Thermoanaerobaculales bacterium]
MSRVKSTKLAIGIALMASFIAVLVVFFMPVFAGQNGLDALDSLYNSISKGSAYYVPKVQHLVDEHGSEVVTLDLKLADPGSVEQLLAAAGATTAVEGDSLTVSGDLKAIFSACLADADAAYHNRDEELRARYGVSPRAALYGWWQALKEMERNLKRQKLFAAADLTHTVQAKTVECAYNYHGIVPQSIKDRWGIVLFSLIFYVVYTVWYGYAIMYIFEGLGFELAAH